MSKLEQQKALPRRSLFRKKYDEAIPLPDSGVKVIGDGKTIWAKPRKAKKAKKR
jgi:hypothetical protein